jgi:hypothetical protein
MTLRQPGDRTEHAAEPVGHEVTDVNLGGVYIFALGLFVTVLVVAVVAWMLFAYFSGREARRSAPRYPLAAAQQDRLPPAPRLQVNPRDDLRQLRAREDELLGSYGWMDRDRGVVRIPISEAMKLTVQRGLPTRGKP